MQVNMLYLYTCKRLRRGHYVHKIVANLQYHLLTATKYPEGVLADN